MSKEARTLHEMTDRPQLKHGGVLFLGKIEEKMQKWVGKHRRWCKLVLRPFHRGM